MHFYMQLKSVDLPVDSDCTNYSQLEQVYSHLELYDTIVNTMSAVSRVVPVALSVTNRCNFTTKLIRPYLDK